MTSATLEKELHDELERLPMAQRQKVLRYARQLSSHATQGAPGKELLKFAGTLSPTDAREMMDAIEAGCEQVDPDEW